MRENQILLGPLINSDAICQATVLLLAESAQDDTTRLLFANYLSVLRGKQPALLPLPVKHKISDDPLRVTMFCAEMFTNRVHRLALCAKAYGAKVQLLLGSTQQKYTSADTECFDHIEYVGNSFFEMERINRLMRAFQTDVVHCHAAGLGVDAARLLPFVLTSCAPTVIDYYDLYHATFSGRTRPAELTNTLFYEKTCFEYADGLCMRSPYLKLDRVRSIYKPDVPAILMQDPARGALCVHKAPDQWLKGINLLIDCTDARGSTRLLKRVQKAINQAARHKGIHLHLSRAEHLPLRYDKEKVTIYGEIPYDEFNNFIGKMDARLLIMFKEYFDELHQHTDIIPYISHNSVVSAIESDLICILPREQVFMGKTLRRASRLIEYSVDDIDDNAFWENLPARIAALRKQPSTPEFLTIEKRAHLLKKFYQQAIRHAVRKRADTRCS